MGFFFSTPTSPSRHMTENRPRRSWTTNPAEKKELRGPPSSSPTHTEPSTECPEERHSPRRGSHFGRRPHIIGRQRIPNRHPSAGTLDPASKQGHPFEEPLEYSLKTRGPEWASHRHVPGPERYTGPCIQITTKALYMLHQNYYRPRLLL